MNERTKKKMNNKTINYILLVLIFIVGGFFIYDLTNKPYKEKTVTVEKRDTIVLTEFHTDTIFADKITYKPQYIYDTVHIDNNVYIKDTSLIYSDSTENYNIDIQAVKLDWYKLDYHKKDTITLYETNIVEKIVKEKKNRFGFGVIGGFGWDLLNNKPTINIGLGVCFNLSK